MELARSDTAAGGAAMAAAHAQDAPGEAPRLVWRRSTTVRRGSGRQVDRALLAAGVAIWCGVIGWLLAVVAGG